MLSPAPAVAGSPAATPLSFSFSVTMTAARIRSFAEATGDFNKLHFDADAARAIFKDALAPVAHGDLVIACLGSGIVQQLTDGTMLRKAGAWQPKTYVAQDETAEYEVTEVGRQSRGPMTFIELSARIFVKRNGQRLEFTKEPISICLYRQD